MKMTKRFLIIDDDPFNNVMCDMMIKNVLDEVDVKTFESPEEGLLFIESEYGNNSAPTILLLDINMPTLTGWQFMEEFERFTEAVKERFIVYILSSSVDQRDKDTALAYQSIRGFISKPLERTTICDLANMVPLLIGD